MKSIKKRWTVLAALVLSFVMLAAGALSVFAANEMSPEVKDAYTENVESFLSEIFLYDDATLDQMREQGGFYEVLVDTIRDNRGEVGAYIGTDPVEIDDSGDQVAATANVKFEKYDAETIIYFDYNEDARSYEPRNFVMNVDYPLSMRIAQAGQNTITGLLVVFVVLFFLAFVISMFKYVNPDVRKKKQADETDAVPHAAAASANRPTVPAAAGQAPGAAEDEDEIAAVIAAAIAAAEADMPSAAGYYVRSVRRRASDRNWKRA